ncbi:MAG: hypothetical protein H6637_04185 [Ardenticatenales bacterium]|nr:hypothetical protein [Ardenticatenales bacterium]
MARNITLKCHTCGHEWTVDLDQERPERTIYRAVGSPSSESTIYRGDPAPPERIASYRFACPVDGSYVMVEVPIKE